MAAGIVTAGPMLDPFQDRYRGAVHQAQSRLGLLLLEAAAASGHAALQLRLRHRYLVPAVAAAFPQIDCGPRFLRAPVLPSAVLCHSQTPEPLSDVILRPRVGQAAAGPHLPPDQPSGGNLRHIAAAALAAPDNAAVIRPPIRRRERHQLSKLLPGQVPLTGMGDLLAAAIFNRPG